MRVAHFCKYFSPLSETFIYDAITELERQGLDNHVVTRIRTQPEERPFEKTYVVDGPHRFHPRRLWHRALAQFGIGKFGKDEKNWTRWPVLRTRMKKILRQIAPDVIHAQFGPAGVLVAPVARALNVPLLVTFHGADITKLAEEDRWRRAYQSLFPQADALLGVSSHICKRMTALGAPAHKVEEFHLGTQIDQFDYRERPSNSKGPVQCLHVGRLVEKKAPLLLVEAFRQAQERAANKGVELRLSIAGDGSLRSELERCIQESGLTDSVDVLGAVPHERVVELMREADIYTQHSVTAADGNQEGLPIGLIEATATGLPVVSTWHSGIPDLVMHDETGLLVEERNVEAMGRCIAELAADPERRRAMGRAGRRRVEEHFDLSKQMRKLAGIYEDVCSKKPRNT